ncbi:MAG: two-component system sensor histidine kinase/response regulator [bacterium]
MNKQCILYVDDEEPNLVAFRAIFRREFNVITATSAEEGRQKLDNNPDVKVVISDYLMKGITGIEFFESILEKHPYIIRIILTGFADYTAMLDSINKARVYRFLSKPWNEYDLRQTILSAMELYDARKDIAMHQKELEKSYDSLNQFVHTASNEMRSTLVSMHGIVRIAKLESTSEGHLDYWPILEKGIMQIDLQLRNIIEHYEADQRIGNSNKIDFVSIIDRCKRALDNFQDFSNITLNVVVRSTESFFNDPFRVQLVISNLLTYVGEQINPDKGKINLDIEVIDAKNGIQIMFTDDGIGIDNEQLDGLFELILSKGSSQDISLYLVKQATGNMGGTIDVTSVPGEGTSFNIFLPNNETETNAHSAN